MYQISNPIQFYPYRPLALCDFSVYHRQQSICSRISPLILQPPFVDATFYRPTHLTCLTGLTPFLGAT